MRRTQSREASSHFGESGISNETKCVYCFFRKMPLTEAKDLGLSIDQLAGGVMFHSRAIWLVFMGIGAHPANTEYHLICGSHMIDIEPSALRGDRFQFTDLTVFFDAGIFTQLR